MRIKTFVFEIYRKLLLQQGYLRNLLVFLLLINISPAFSQKKPQELFDKIKSYLPGDISKAEKLVLEYSNIGMSTDDEEINAKTDYLYGLIHYHKSRYYISNKYYSKALNSEYAKSDLRFTEKCWNNMGINYEIQNMFPESLAAYQKSLKIAESLKDSISIGQSWINVGLLNAKAKKYKRAQQITLKALGYFENKKDSSNIALCYQNLTFIATEERDYYAAINYTFKSLAISLALKNQYEIGSSYYNLANNFSLIGDLKQSNFYLDKALEVAPEILEREAILAKIYMQRGINQTASGAYKEAENNLKYAHDLIIASGASENDNLIYQSLADLYAKSGNYAAYSEIIRQYDEVNQQKAINESNARIDELQALYDFQKNTDKIEDQQRDIVNQQKKLSILIGLIVVILFILITIIIMHIRMRRYTRSLFENRVEQTIQGTLVPAPIQDDETDNKPLLAIYNQIVNLMNDKSLSKEFNISDLSAELHISENQISQAIHLFGKKDYHSFLNSYYIDNICRKMIANGKKVPLKTIIRESPFANSAEFRRQFKEITGLTPEQFMDYSEQKLQQERKGNVTVKGLDI